MLESIQRLVASSAVVPRPPSVLVSRTQTGDALARFPDAPCRTHRRVPGCHAIVRGTACRHRGAASDRCIRRRPFSIDDIDDDVLRHLDELASTLTTIRSDVDARLDASHDLIDQAASATDAADRLDALTRAAKTVFGEAFTIVPTFDIPVASRGELRGAMAYSTSGELLRFQRVDRANREPVDTWLYGVARVRDAMHVWEQIVMHGEAFGGWSAALTPIQLPASPALRWLALEFPSDTVLNGEHLLLHRALRSRRSIQPFRNAACSSMSGPRRCRQRSKPRPSHSTSIGRTPSRRRYGCSRRRRTSARAGAGTTSSAP